MYRLFTVKIEILDDKTFDADQMQVNIAEALEIHLEAIKVIVHPVDAEDVIADVNDIAEA